MSQTKEHYSYRVYGDPKTARTFDSERFGGTIGELLKQTQEQIVFSVLQEVQGWKIIDVGAGTGRFTIPLIEKGAAVTACDASQEMLKVLTGKISSQRLQVVVQDAHNLEFSDQKFDCAISFRMLMHVVDWKKALGELCRVSSDWVIIDFPPRRGFLLLAPLWHRIRSLSSDDVQAYHTLSISEVKSELDHNGFEPAEVDWGLFLPLVVHRKIGSIGFTKASERFLAGVGLTRITGSPVTLFARRKK